MKFPAVLIALLFVALTPEPLRAQSYDDYVDTWTGERRARFVTYRFDRPDLPLNKAGWVSDRPLEWSQNLGIGGENQLVDPFEVGEGAKHVLIMVHGYGPGDGYRDRDDEFSTEFVEHDTGVWAWFHDPTGPGMYTYLRELPGGSFVEYADDGFDPDEWVILGVTIDLSQGSGLSILDNQERLRALIDLLWHHKSHRIKTISIASHSTGGPTVKGVLGSSDAVNHPWINYVDDHLNLAGALGGTKIVFVDLPAGVGAPELRHQLMYGIQHPDDFTGAYRYTAGRTAESGVFKRSYRWPSHINVLSVAGVVLGPLDGNPWSGDRVAVLPWNVSNVLDQRYVNVFDGKNDGVVPSMGVLEQVQYKQIDLNPLPGDPFEWRYQIGPEHRYGVDYSSNWTLPAEETLGIIFPHGGAGWIDADESSNADNIPASDRYRGSRVTYVEVGAQHNGMLHNEHLLRAMRKRLGTYTVKLNVERPVVTDVSPASGPPEGGNTVDIYGSGFRHITQIYFGSQAVLGPFDVNNPPPMPWTIISESHLRVEVPAAVPRLAGDPSRYFVDVQVVNPAGASLGNGTLDDYEYLYPAATPTITPDGGEFDAPPTATIASETPGAIIYYTLNGSEPYAGNPAVHVYSDPILIPVPLEAAPITLKARAVKVAFSDSDVSEAVFNVDAALPTPAIFPDGGDFTGFVNITIGTAPGISVFYTTDGTDPTYLSTHYTGQFQLGVGDHTIKARAYAIGYNASAISEATFRVYDSSTERVADPVLYPLGSGQFTDSVYVRMVDYTEGATIRYTIGQNEAPANPTESDPAYTEPFVLTFDQADVDQTGSTSWFIRAKAFKDGLPPSNVLQRNYEVSPALAETAEPTFSPAPDTFYNPVFVSIESATQFARLYVTTDGTEAIYDPDIASHATPHQRTLTKTTLLRALAKRGFFSASDEMTGEYVLKGATPVLSGEPTTALREVDGVSIYVDSVAVSLSSETGNATIRYTLDGSEPVETSAQYDEPFYLRGTATVTARAFKSGYLHSNLASRTFLVQQGAAPVITRQPESLLVEAGASATFRVAADAVPEPSYQWQLDEVDLVGATADTLHITAAALEDAGAYRVLVSNPAGTVPSAEALLNVDPSVIAPTIVIHPTGGRIALGGVATLSAAASGKPSPTYRWLKDGEPLADADGAQLTLGSLTESDAGSFQAIAENAAGADTSDAAGLEIYAGAPPTVVSQPSSLTLAPGDTARFEIEIAGDPAPAVQWMRDGVALPFATADSLVIYGVTLDDAGEYAALIMNVAGLDTSEVAVLNVDASVATEDLGGVPQTFALHANYPNPFNPSTTLSFDLAKGGDVRIVVYDVLGRQIALLRDSELTAGRYRERFDFSHLASGLYFYEIHVGGPSGTLFRDVRQFILMK